MIVPILRSDKAHKETSYAECEDYTSDEHPKIDAHDQTAVDCVAICLLVILKVVARADTASVHVSVEKRQDPANRDEALWTFEDSIQHHKRFSVHALVAVIDAADGKDNARGDEHDLPRKHKLLSNIRSLAVRVLLWFNSELRLVVRQAGFGISGISQYEVSKNKEIHDAKADLELALLALLFLSELGHHGSLQIIMSFHGARSFLTTNIVLFKNLLQSTDDII